MAIFRFASFLVLLTSIAPMIRASTLSDDLYVNLSRQAPALDQKVLQSALNSMECAILNGVSAPENLAIIDYRLPSSKKRLWIFNLQQQTLMLTDLVAHGKNSGKVSATSFSNKTGSLQSSLGLFRGQETYYGKHGYSLRLEGLEPGINDKARDRAIVIHGASYVDQSWIKNHGRIGRSFGCPAVRKNIAKKVIDSLKDGQLLFSYYPESQWLDSSSFLNCNGNEIALKDNPENTQATKRKRQFTRIRKG